MKILLCKIKSICYGSTYFFIEKLRDALEAFGCQVEIFDSSTTPLKALENYEGSHYDAIIDFNSILPSITTDKDEYFLNTIDAPFYNYILDHPIYHHDMLKKAINNYNVICLDEYHCSYIQKNYPNINKVILMPLGTDIPDSMVIPMSERKHDILFTGTYTDPNKALALIKDMGPTLSSDLLKLSDILIEEPSLTIEAAAKILFDSGVTYKNYAEHMKIFFLVDTFITAYFRMKLLHNVASSGCRLTIVGQEWNKSPLSMLHNVKLVSAMPFKYSIDEMGNAKIVLNSMPWFKGGLHDRIISAMSRHAVAFSDDSTYIEKYFSNKKDIVTFPTKEMSQCPDILLNLFEAPDNIEKIAENGFNNVKHNHLWSNRASQFIAHISKDCSKLPRQNIQELL